VTRSKGWRVLAPAAALWLVAGGACDHGLGPGPDSPTGIAGRVDFVGPWSPEVGEVAVAVYRRHPRELADFLELSGYQTGLEPGAASLDYFVELQREGVYEWVIVAWRRPDAFWDFTSLLGCYHSGGDTLPTAVPVTLGRVTEGIDIRVDLRILAGGAPAERALCSGALPPELLDEAGP